MKRTGRKALKRLRRNKVDPSTDIPGPTASPSSNLIISDVVMRMGSYMMRRALERNLLKGRYGKKTARQIVKNRSLKQTLASAVIARMALGSLPGAAIVTTGMAAKVLLDRSKARRKAKGDGDAELIRQAKDD